MNNFFDKFVDFFFLLLSRLSILLIIAVLGFIISTRIEKLFDIELISAQNINFYSQAESQDDNVEQKATISYGSGINEENVEMSSESIQNEAPKESNIEIITFEIAEGQTPEDVSNVLRDAGLITDPPTFISLLNEYNMTNEIKPGVYNVPANIKNLDLIETITIAQKIEENNETTENIETNAETTN